jgi:hypothetical protein
MNLRLFFIAAYFALLLSRSYAQRLPAQDTYGQEIKTWRSSLGIHMTVDPDYISWVTVWFVVDTKGKTQYARILGSSLGKKNQTRVP